MKPALELYECQNCGHTAAEDKMAPAKDITLRFLPGDTFSDLECPKCGAICLPVNRRKHQACQ